jgi:hypothetical protein
MKKVILFEQFIAEAKSTEEIAAKILGELDKNAQLYADYIPKEALGAINKVLKKNKSLIGKDAELAAKQIRMNLEDIGILSNTLSPFDVEMIIMNHLNESTVNEAKFKVGDSWEWNHVDGVKIVTITNVKPNGDVVARAEGESRDFIVRDANKYLKKKVNESLVNEAKSFEMGDSFEYIPNKGSIYTITRKMAFGQKWIITGDKNPDNKFILNDAEINQWIKDGKLVPVDESLVNEAKELDRDALMNLLETKYKIKTVRTSEEFNGQTEGIWVAGDNGEEMSGNKIFDYYNSSAKYANGILKQVRGAVEKTGWWFEWNDPGTLIIWPKKL